jgi:hypothetical protein
MGMCTRLDGVRRGDVVRAAFGMLATVKVALEWALSCCHNRPAPADKGGSERLAPPGRVLPARLSML